MFPSPDGTNVMLGDLDIVSAIYLAASNFLISIYALLLLVNYDIIH